MPPGPVPAEVMERPATLPFMLAIQLEATEALMASLDTFDTAYPSDFSSRVRPSAVTTTSAILVADSFIVTSIVVRLPTGMVWVS